LGGSNLPTLRRAGHYDGRHFVGHKSPAAKARELFKPSTDLGRLYFRLKKKFSFGFGILCGGRHKWECFRIFGQLYLVLGANLMSHFFARVFFGN